MSDLSWGGGPLVAMTDDELDQVRDHAVDCTACYCTTMDLLDEIGRLRNRPPAAGAQVCGRWLVPGEEFCTMPFGHAGPCADVL